MHFKVTVDIYNRKNKLLNERVVYIRRDSISEVFEVVRKIRGAKWNSIYTIGLPAYVDGVSKQ